MQMGETLMPLDKSQDSPSASIRAKLDHPEIDANG